MKDLLDKYHEFTKTTAIYPGADIIRSADALEYLSLAFIGESGEIADKYKKVIRDNNGVISEEVRQGLSKELGDVMYYISQMCNTFEYKLYNLVDINSIDSIQQDPAIPLGSFIRVLNTRIGNMSEQIQSYLVGLTGPRKIAEEINVDIANIALLLFHIAKKLNLKIEDIINENMEKLQSRKDRGVISGSGDSR